MPLISDSAITINGIVFTEQGSDPTTPSTGKWTIYTKSDGVYVIDDTGSTTGPFATASVSGAYDYVCIQDQKAQNTQSGTFTQGAWRTRDLNTEVADAGNRASVASNQITLAAGTYITRIVCPSFDVNRHQARLYNISDSAEILLGTSSFSGKGSNGADKSIITGRFTLAASKVLEVQHYCQSTTANQGFGVEANISTEIYTVAEFWREA